MHIALIHQGVATLNTKIIPPHPRGLTLLAVLGLFVVHELIPPGRGQNHSAHHRHYEALGAASLSVVGCIVLGSLIPTEEETYGVFFLRSCLSRPRCD